MWNLFIIFTHPKHINTMARKYEQTMDANTEHEWTKLRKGLKQVHIGDDVWLIGKVSKVDNPEGADKYPIKVDHQVIYGPNNKEYHLYGKDVDFVNEETDEYGYTVAGYVNKSGNRTIQQKAKIYILTHILDKKENWCFDISNIPLPGKLKVIYANGTVKNVIFDGTFNKHEGKYKRMHNAFAYRIQNG